jgi:hypothetical protein
MRPTSPAIHRLAAAALLMGCAMQPLRAQSGQPECGLRVASGPAGKVYALMVRDMQTICGAEVDLCAVQSSGGLQNLSMLSANEGDLGIVQVDTLTDMVGSDDNIAALQAVLPLHANLLHVITLSEGSTVGASIVPFSGRKVVVRKFSELKGLKVATVGSAQLLGQTLEKQLGYGMGFVVAENDEQALDYLRSGQVQAVFTLGGWPLPSITRHKINSGVMLADYDLAPQAPYTKIRRNYQNLETFNLSFLGVPNLLVTRPFKAGGTLSNRVSALQACLRQHLDELQEGRYQAVWKEIKDPSMTYGIKAYVGKVPTNYAPK